MTIININYRNRTQIFAYFFKNKGHWHKMLKAKECPKMDNAYEFEDNKQNLWNSNKSAQSYKL